MIELININKNYGENDLFKNFNLSIQEGSFNVIYGPSGCGKTTLLNIIGLFEYRNGIVKIDGREYAPRSKESRKLYKRKIGYILQNFGLVTDVTVKENLRIIDSNVNRMKEVLQKYGIENKLNEYVYSLSGGEAQRVALAMMDLKNVEIILADEPTGSLDDNNRDFVIEQFKKFQEEGKTIIVVTHDEEFLKHATQKIFL